ncbi:hypothetical protein PN478_01175 [Dolichospermum circinale CS-534/05]|uniref:hypothetical protein n=1 Tax=Dolichospermum circinale TaxID=109265 RepID=UPI00232EA149|nr:hypothetical protein [Dolichospermum circinale]MDB9489144.1 hypothetical protein [Dolichospermum circinale CS-534/05]
MNYYVTLFDSNYLTRGLVMYRSLLSHAGEFHLWIICFDDLAYQLLQKLNLEKVTLVSLLEFEDSELLKIKPQRTQKEYCWTCTPSTLLYVLNTEPHVDTVTYLDADLMFFSSPEPIFTEAKNASILLTEHRYLPEYDQSATSGIYNVQFMMFRRNIEGLNALTWWRDRCIEWCYARCENGKFGDQKYLDDWKERFPGVHIVEHLGSGLAPWNAAQYNLTKKGENIFVEEYPLIFYHFHALKIHPFKIGYLSNYPLKPELCEWVYYPYYQQLNQSYQEIQNLTPGFKLGIVNFPKPPKRPDNLYRFIRSVIKDIGQGRYYYYA